MFVRVHYYDVFYYVEKHIVLVFIMQTQLLINNDRFLFFSSTIDQTKCSPRWYFFTAE